MEIVNIIMVPQEHDVANHLGLWEQLAARSAGPTVVVNIGADVVVSIAKLRIYRMREALGSGRFRQVGSYCLLRPLFVVRPEVAGRWINRLNMVILVRQLEKVLPDIRSRRIRVLVYSGLWAALIRQAFPNSAIGYYVLDEVTRTASTDAVHPKRVALDRTGCDIADAVFLMSSALRSPRIEFSDKLQVIGNGAEAPNHGGRSPHPIIKRPLRRIGLIGNFRDWIDRDLLRELVGNRPDLEFGLLGNVETNMAAFVEELVRDHANVTYHGKVAKHDVAAWYREFDVVIVPYRRNTFVSATRPIKIVEAVFAGVPVVSVPVAGYCETEFIRFAVSSEDFSNAIDRVSPINQSDPAYLEFVDQNSWQRVARDIIERMDRVDR